MLSPTELLAGQNPCDHLVQFYGDPRDLVRHVGRYLKEGAARGDWMIVIAAPDRRAEFKKELSADGVAVGELVTLGRLTLLDAEATLSRFMVSGLPDRSAFDGVVGELVRQTRKRAGGACVRAYGEMVDLLWTSGRLEAATTLEALWNDLLQRERFSLYCAYAVDVLDGSVPTPALKEMLATHSHLLPARVDGELDRAVARAVADVLGVESARRIMPLVRAARQPGASLPPAAATVLWLRANLPAHAGAVLSRARACYEEECAAKGFEGRGRA